MRRDDLAKCLRDIQRQQEDLLEAVHDLKSAVGAATHDGFLVSRMDALEICLKGLLTEHQRALRAVAGIDEE